MVRTVQYLIEIWIFRCLTIYLVELHASQLLIEILDQLVFNKGSSTTREDNNLPRQVSPWNLLDCSSCAKIEIVFPLW